MREREVQREKFRGMERQTQMVCSVDTVLLMLAVIGSLISEMRPNATWMHQDNLEGGKNRNL